MVADEGQVEQLFQAQYAAEQAAIHRLAALDRKKLGAGAADNLKMLKEVAANGLAQSLAKRRKSPTPQDEIKTLVDEFLRFGAKAGLLTGSQRVGDFLNNQLRGQWAERVALSMAIGDLHLVEFGPSGAAMPGEEDHREVIMTFREIHLLEGKRPDLLAFGDSVWEGLDDSERRLALTWPNRRLEQRDEEIVKKARCGIEVKNSTWHYGQRRRAGGGPLSITVKREEVAEIRGWSSKTGLPVIFLQVLFDELYCMSFARMDAAIQRGHLYVAGDYELDDQTTDKAYHKFHIAPPRHLCGKVVFPSESMAEVRVLEDGHVVPFIRFEPARATGIDSAMIREEIAHVEPITPPAPPPSPSP